VSKHYAVDVIHDGQSACEKLLRPSWDLLILDLNLPKIDGMEVLRQIRISQPLLAILVLTARSQTSDLVSALERGADDFLIKPFSLLELLARVRSLLRRNSAPAVSVPKGGRLTINREEHWVLRGERRIHLTARELDLLEYFMKNEGKTLSREAIMRDVWNIPFDSSTNILEVYLKYLRDKVDLAGETRLIHTVRGVGYLFSNDPQN